MDSIDPPGKEQRNYPIEWNNGRASYTQLGKDSGFVFPSVIDMNNQQNAPVANQTCISAFSISNRLPMKTPFGTISYTQTINACPAR